MQTIFLITLVFIILYLSYPLWLIILSKNSEEIELNDKETDNVTLIYLSQNGAKYLNDKLAFLFTELTAFKNSELIVIDDNSSDNSLEILTELKKEFDFRIISKPERKGIPHSMNTGYHEAKYDTIIFCDQRQKLSHNIIKRLIQPLGNDDTGAVSSCIATRSQNRGFSFIRQYENFIKLLESKTGNLIGVYGPLYAIKKECYSLIPEYVILDDLYLTLKILGSKKVRFLKECEIYEEGTDFNYDYRRVKRYLSGLIQVVKEKGVISNLKKPQIAMLILHKYIRLLFPILFFICYVSIGLQMGNDIGYIIAFLIISLIGIVSLLSDKLKINFMILGFVQINIQYLFAFSKLFIVDPCLKKIFSPCTSV